MPGGLCTPTWPTTVSLLPLKGGSGTRHDSAALCDDGRIIYVWLDGDEARQSHYPTEAHFAAADNASATAGVALSGILSTPTQGFTNPTTCVWRHTTTGDLYLFTSHVESQGGGLRWRSLVWSSPSNNGESAPGVPDWVLHGTIQDFVTAFPNFFGAGPGSSNKTIGQPYVGTGGRLILPGPRYFFDSIGGSTFIVVFSSVWTSDDVGVTWTLRLSIDYPATGQGGMGTGRTIVPYNGNLWWSSRGNVNAPVSAFSSDNGTSWTTFNVPGTANSDFSIPLTADGTGLHIVTGGVLYDDGAFGLEHAPDPPVTPRASRTMILANLPGGTGCILEQVGTCDYYMFFGNILAMNYILSVEAWGALPI